MTAAMSPAPASTMSSVRAIRPPRVTRQAKIAETTQPASQESAPVPIRTEIPGPVTSESRK